MLNDRPYYVRAVLEQGYWPDTDLSAPSVAALRQEVQVAKDLGPNTVRVHQKFEDPRYLYWADRLGVRRLAPAGVGAAVCTPGGYREVAGCSGPLSHVRGGLSTATSTERRMNLRAVGRRGSGPR